jgi:CHAD domain-containing protein
MAKTKPLDGLDCDGPALAGMALVLSIRMEEMYSFRNHALNSHDPEGVHNMRVASRRLRSALVDFMPYLGKARFNNSLKDIEALAHALGRVRDSDVAIITLKEAQTRLPLSSSVQGLVVFRNLVSTLGQAVVVTGNASRSRIHK